MEVKKYKQFRVGDLFDIHPTKAYKGNNSDLFDENGKTLYWEIQALIMVLAAIHLNHAQKKVASSHFLIQQLQTQFFISQNPLLDIAMCKGCIHIRINGQRNLCYTF